MESTYEGECHFKHLLLTGTLRDNEELPGSFVVECPIPYCGLIEMKKIDKER